jgi:hypothetical protein
MEPKEIYPEIAKLVGARNRCEKQENWEWYEKYTMTIKQFMDKLPHGSGLDSDWILEDSTEEKLVFRMGYHVMNENGYYDEWIDFTLTVTGSLAYGVNIKIVGKFGKHQDIRDYLYELLQ